MDGVARRLVPIARSELEVKTFQLPSAGGVQGGGTPTVNSGTFERVLNDALHELNCLEGSYDSARARAAQEIGGLPQRDQTLLRLQTAAQELGIKTQLISQIVEATSGALKKLQQAGQG